MAGTHTERRRAAVARDFAAAWVTAGGGKVAGELGAHVTRRDD